MENLDAVVQGARPTANRQEADLLRLELEAYLGLYKHHFDLFMKTIVIYLAVVGAVAGYVFRPETNVLTRAALSLFVCVGSILAVVGCRFAAEWGDNAELQMLRITQSLGIPLITLAPGPRFARLVGVFLYLDISSERSRSRPGRSDGCWVAMKGVFVRSKGRSRD